MANCGDRIAWYRAGFEIRWCKPREFESPSPRLCIKQQSGEEIRTRRELNINNRNNRFGRSSENSFITTQRVF